MQRVRIVAPMNASTHDMIPYLSFFHSYAQTFSFDSSLVTISVQHVAFASRYLDDHRDISRPVSCGTRSRRNAACVYIYIYIRIAAA